MARPRHPNKDIEKALQHSEKNGWDVIKITGSGHAWGLMRCPTNAKCRNGHFCQQSIWSTPKNPQTHAKRLQDIIDKCEG
jgi:hypothetical protein